jgi:hypothetical protein
MPYIDKKRRWLFIPILEKFPEMDNEQLVKLFVELGIRFTGQPYSNDWVSQLPEYGVGDMNFIMTWLLHKAVEDRGLKYANLNDLMALPTRAARHLIKNMGLQNDDSLMGVYDCCKLEFYRRIVARYENTKIDDNGAVSKLEVKLNCHSRYYGNCSNCGGNGKRMKSMGI